MNIFTQLANLPLNHEFTSFEAIEKLVLIIVAGLCVVLATKYLKSMWAGLLIIIMTLALSLQSIRSQGDIVVFVLGVVFGYISDIWGVYTHKWRYPTKSGYSIWVGVGWGLVTLVIYQMRTVSILVIIPLLVAGAWILLIQKSDLPRSRFEWIFMVLKALTFIFYLAIFILSLTIGLIIEYLAVEIFHIWKYARVSYLAIGLGYTLLVISAVATTEALLLGRVAYIPFILLLWLLYLVESVWIKN